MVAITTWVARGAFSCGPGNGERFVGGCLRVFGHIIALVCGSLAGSFAGFATASAIAGDVCNDWFIENVRGYTCDLSAGYGAGSIFAGVVVGLIVLLVIWLVSYAIMNAIASAAE